MKPAFFPDHCYHIYTRANGNENLFRTSENYRYFLQKFQQYMTPVVDTLAYCLMPNHIHFLVVVRSEEQLQLWARTRYTGVVPEEPRLISLQVSHLLNGYAKAYNKMYKRHGSLFQSKIRRKVVDTDDYYTRLIVYIHQNPVKHGFVKRIDDWPHSSFSLFTSGEPTFVNRDEVLSWFGGIQPFLLAHQFNIDEFF